MAHDIEKLRELLERVEKASGPDQVLDGDVWIFLDDEPLRADGPPCYTASLDSSVALVERMLPGWGRMAYWNNCQGHLCAVEDNANSYEGSTNQTFEALGATSALALLAAMLKALISQAEGEAQHG